MAPTIRKAVFQDVPHLVALWREMWDFHTRFDPRYEVTAIAETVMAKWFEENLRNSRVLILVACPQATELGGKDEEPEPAAYIHAMIMENPPTVPHMYYGYISEIAVAESARHQGMGLLLVQSAHDWFKQNNISYVEVNVSVKNAISQSFWRKCGYTDYLERLRIDLHGPQTDR